MPLVTARRGRSAVLTALVALATCDSIGCGDRVDPAREDEKDAGWTCPAGARCDDGSVCFGRVCESRSNFRVEVTASDARSCDLLFELGDPGRFVSAAWADGVRGHAETRGLLVGVALIATADELLTKVPVTLSTTGGMPTVRSATCADRLGVPLQKLDVDVKP